MTIPAMMTNAITIEDKSVETTQTIAKLSNAIDNKDIQISTLVNKLEAQNINDSSHYTKISCIKIIRQFNK